MRLLLILTFFLSLTHGTSASSILKENEIVVIIHSYGKGELWTDSLEKGIRNTLLNELEIFQVSSEYMDTKRFVGKAYEESLQRTYIEKFKDKKIRAFITTDDNAFLFAIELRKKLKIDIPIIFSGVNGYLNYKDGILKVEKNITGVLEALPFKENLDLISKVHPTTKRLYFINTVHSPSGRYVKKMFKKIVASHKFPFKIIYVENMRMEDIYKLSQKFESDSAVLFGVYSRDSAGNYFHFTENMKKLSDHSSRPIYALLDTYLNSGIVGGTLISGHDHGVIAANKAISLLSGKSITDTPIEKKPPNTTYFDYSVLSKFNMKIKDLPLKAEYVNRPFGLKYFYRNFPKLFWMTISSITFLFLTIGLLTLVLRNKLSFEKKIIDLNKTLEMRVEQRTQKIKEQQEKLVDTAKLASVGEMASSIAHEINNPLAIIKMLSKKLLKNLGDHEESRSVKKMDETVDRIAKIIKSLKAISRKDDTDFEITCLEDVVLETIHLSESRFKNAGIDIRHNLSDSKSFINANYVQIAQVILNLLNNAFDATSELEEKWVSVEIDKGEEIIKLLVQDSGQIVDEEVYDKIMNPFFTTKDVGKGTGLGLSISNSIMAHHHGDIYLDRNSDKTTFVLSFPVSSKTLKPAKVS